MPGGSRCPEFQARRRGTSGTGAVTSRAGRATSGTGRATSGTDASVSLAGALVPLVSARVPLGTAPVPLVTAVVCRTRVLVPGTGASVPLMAVSVPLVAMSVPLVTVSVPLVTVSVPLVTVSVPLVILPVPLVGAVVPGTRGLRRLARVLLPGTWCRVPLVGGLSRDSLRRALNRRSFTRDPLRFPQKAVPRARRSATPPDPKSGGDGQPAGDQTVTSNHVSTSRWQEPAPCRWSSNPID